VEFCSEGILLPARSCLARERSAEIILRTPSFEEEKTWRRFLSSLIPENEHPRPESASADDFRAMRSERSRTRAAALRDRAEYGVLRVTSLRKLVTLNLQYRSIGAVGPTGRAVKRRSDIRKRAAPRYRRRNGRNSPGLLAFTGRPSLDETSAPGADPATSSFFVPSAPSRNTPRNRPEGEICSSAPTNPAET